jgi:hypothetical protein
MFNLEHFNLLSFGIIGDSETCPSQESYDAASGSLDVELSKLQSNLRPQQR